ncbi:MAG: acyl-CoA transferase [Hyphomicrobiales bacterium]|nr:acyl-CoA transferase [Hyphomicrobiales bacterium]
MSHTTAMIQDLWSGLGGTAKALSTLRETGEGSLVSAFAVSDFAAATTAAAALALAEHVALLGRISPEVTVDRRLASLWFSKSIRPLGWSLPPQWDAVAGDYEARDGWIRLHTNAPHHRRAALGVLEVEEDRAKVAAAVRRWSAADLEDAMVGSGGCAARMMSSQDWAAHPQGRAVGLEPLMAFREGTRRVSPDRRFDAARPLAGIRVLDLTRVLAGPVATRFLAGCGADVLRIDPPGWDEPAVLPEVTLGKRRARLDLRDAADRAIFEGLLARADVFVHGYRSDALSRLGYDDAAIEALSPGLVDVALDAYGWTGPWSERRGFDSLVQMSSGIAARGQSVSGASKPVPMPVQALDYGAGCLMAAAVLRGLTRRAESGRGVQARTSLARTAAFLALYPAGMDQEGIASESDADLAPEVEDTHWGAARRLRPPATVEGAPMSWDLPAGPLGDSAPGFAS